MTGLYFDIQREALTFTCPEDKCRARPRRRCRDRVTRKVINWPHGTRLALAPPRVHESCGRLITFNPLTTFFVHVDIEDEMRCIAP